MTSPALSIRGLHKTYNNGLTALHPLDLDVAPGSFVDHALPRRGRGAVRGDHPAALLRAAFGAADIAGVYAQAMAE